MEEALKIILEENIHLFGSNPTVEKINVGFTNRVYSINNSYILKICKDPFNESSFKNEINFYLSNKENEYIPKLIKYDTSMKNVDYMYEIIEKIEGVSLYNIWHKLDNHEKKYILEELSKIMKSIHRNVSHPYDWVSEVSNWFMVYYDRTKELFDESERKIIEYAFSKFPRYLESDDFVLVHNDIHFDNVFYSNGKLKIIDFERSLYAPRDFELDIFGRMLKSPWKFSSEETEKYVAYDDYKHIEKYMRQLYPKLYDVKFLEQRLAIYEMVYNLELLIEYSNSKDLKNNVIDAAKVVNLRDELKYDQISSPEELMDYMNIFLKYGWVDNEGNKHIETLHNFRRNGHLMSLEEILDKNVATCIGQAKMIKDTLDRLGIENKLYCYRNIETEFIDTEIIMHCFVLFKKDGEWYHFEHSDSNNKGIHFRGTIEEALKKATNSDQPERKFSEIPKIPDNMTFEEFNKYVNTFPIIEVENRIKK